MSQFMPTHVMQELSLYCLIPSTKQSQVLRVFSGICNMNPEPQYIHHLIYKPKRPKPHAMVGAAQQEMYHLQLISKVDEREWERRRRGKTGEQEEANRVNVNNGKDVGGGTRMKEDVIMIDLDEKAARGGGQAGGEKEEKEKEKEKDTLYDIKRQKWTVQFLDFPEAMRTRPVTTRSMYLAEVGDGDVLTFMEDFGYTYVSEYVTSGYNLYHQNLIISLTQTFLPTVQHQPLPRESLRNLDPMQAWVCEVSLRVAQAHGGQSSNMNKEQLEVMNTGTRELTDFRDLVRGVGVELEMGERLALDPRVR